jgi:hypothetical protein
MTNVLQIHLPQEAVNRWEVTVEVKPRFAFLRVVLVAMFTRKTIRIHHTFTCDPRRRVASNKPE